MVRMESQDKLEPRENQETLGLQASLDLQVLLASVTPASVPTMPAWHKDLTPKTWRGNKKEYREGAPSPTVFRNLSVSGTIWKKTPKTHDGGLKRYLLPAFVWRDWDKHQWTISDLTWVQRAAKHFTFLVTCMLPERYSICMVQFPPPPLHISCRNTFLFSHTSFWICYILQRTGSCTQKKSLCSWNWSLTGDLLSVYFP